MRSESEGPDALQDFIRENGNPYAIKSDNFKIQVGELFKKILRRFNIKPQNTEPIILNRIKLKERFKM